MKHPVDTSTWGEFKVGELFETNGKKTFTGASVNKNKLSDGGTPRITVTEKNNGIYGYYSDIDDINYRVYDKFISVSFLGTVFWHNYRASVDMKVHVLTKIKNVSWSDNIALFLITSIKKGISKFSYSDQLSASKLYELEIKLPLKHGTNSADYSQDDIDWDYMEVFMSRVQDAAKERLVNLPEPGQKSKTPIDVSKWGEFKVGELFDKLELKRIKPTFNKHSDLSPVKTDEFDLPLINAKVGNNGIMYYGRSCDWQYDCMTIDIVNDGAASTGMVYAQPQRTGTLYNAYQIKLKQTVYNEPTVSQLLFLTTVIQASIQTKFSYDNKAIWQKVKEESIPLPLKQETNPTDYSQDDIDWDYMEQFMKQFQTLSKNRVEQLSNNIDA